MMHGAYNVKLVCMLDAAVTMQQAIATLVATKETWLSGESKFASPQVMWAYVGVCL